MLRNQLCAVITNLRTTQLGANSDIYLTLRRLASRLSAEDITGILTENEVIITKNVLPNSIQSIECNQLGSNYPIEDRLRVSSVQLPGCKQPTLMLGVFDGHGGGTTADLISRRLFNYIALSLHPDVARLDKLSDHVVDLHNSPPLNEDSPFLKSESKALDNYRLDLGSRTDNIAANIRVSFKRCDDDLSKEIQKNLLDPSAEQSTIRHYLSAAVSGCCALVTIIHEGIGYIASTGDCRAVLGTFGRSPVKDGQTTREFSALDLNDEHNCYNIDEMRRLISEHPTGEKNTVISSHRILGNLAPSRAFGDFNYKWPVEVMKACGLIGAFGQRVVPHNYKTPPYLIAEPDVRQITISHPNEGGEIDGNQKCLVIGSDGLWEFFYSSRDVVETIVDHTESASQNKDEDYDKNCATHILRSALRANSQDFGLDREELKEMNRIRLESLLSLSRAEARSHRDDITIAVIKI